MLKHTRFTRFVVLAICLMMLATLVMGCQPPPVGFEDTGHEIIKVSYPEEPPPPMRTVEIDGVEFKEARDPVGRYGGTFYASSIGSAPKTFNPHASFDATSSTIAGHMFVGLTDTDPYTGETVPHLAKTLEILPDNHTYILTLREGVTWSDGRPITADDVVFTWNDIVKEGLGNPSTRDIISINGQMPEVTKVDDMTVKFVTPMPFAPFKQSLGTAILPKHVVEPVIRKDPAAFSSLWGVTASPDSFVVNGPFILEEYISGQRVVLKRNPKFFMVDQAGNRLPYLDRYIVNFVQDQNAEILQFRQGRLDSLNVPGSQVFYIKLQTTPEFRMYDLGPTTGTTFLVFNLNPRKSNETGKPYVAPHKSAWFRDLNFRKAVDYAVQRDKMVANILRGVGSPLFTAESPASVYVHPKLQEGHPSDIEQARAYLRQSGFTWDSQGRLLDRQGKHVEFELLTNTGNLERESVVVAIKEDLAQLGMKVNAKPIDFNVLVGKMNTSEWEAVVLGLTGSPIEPHGGKNVWESTGGVHLFNQRNPKQDAPGTDIVEPWEREIDRLFIRGATTLDPEKRKEIYWRFQELVYEQVPMIYLYSPKAIVAVRTRIQNFDPTPLGAFHNIESIWIKD